MVDVTIYHECCPKCGADDEEIDACDAPDGTPIAKLRCIECGHVFDIENVWILSE